MKNDFLIALSFAIGQQSASAFTSPGRSRRMCACKRPTNTQLYATAIAEDRVIASSSDADTYIQNESSQVAVEAAEMKTPTTQRSSLVEEETNKGIDEAEQSYRTGLITIGFITLLFASNSPALHSAFSMTANTPPVLLINAAVTTIGLLGVILLSPVLGNIVPDPSKKLDDDADLLSEPSNLITRIFGPSAIAGAELGLWKTLGTTANIYGLSETSSDHGAFLIQLTTLIVPAAQGFMGVPIPTRIWTAIGLALGGVFMFTQDPNQSDCASLSGDLLCALAAIFYATYDLRLFKWGKLVPTDALITTKMVTQSLLSFGLLSILGREETIDFVSHASHRDLEIVGVVAIWSGLAVNCLAPYLQVSGQQAVGPARAQILYASQPLWAAIMSFFLLNEQFGTEGAIGGSAFLAAMFLAATAETPDPNCGVKDCEV